VVQVRTMDDALKGLVEAKERQREGGKKAKMEVDMEKVIKVLAAIPERETQAGICKLTGLQPRIVGHLLITLLEQKKVVQTQVRKSSGQGEKSYDAWRLATNSEFLVAKVEEMGVVPPFVAAKVAERVGKSPVGSAEDKKDKKDKKDMDWLDDEPAAIRAAATPATETALPLVSASTLNLPLPAATLFGAPKDTG
jgi:alkylated DNA nucleotide flippase Atl1